MRRKSSLILLSVFCISLFSFITDGKTKRSSRYKTFFGCSPEGNGIMSAEKFITLMEYPLCAKDSVGNRFKVSSFEIVYAETGLYQDSTGLPIIITDNSFAAFNGDSLSFNWKKNFKERLYKGDTVHVSQVRVLGTDGKNYEGESIDLIIK